MQLCSRMPQVVREGGEAGDYYKDLRHHPSSEGARITHETDRVVAGA